MMSAVWCLFKGILGTNDEHKSNSRRQEEGNVKKHYWPTCSYSSINDMQIHLIAHYWPQEPRLSHSMESLSQSHWWHQMVSHELVLIITYLTAQQDWQTLQPHFPAGVVSVVSLGLTATASLTPFFTTSHLLPPTGKRPVNHPIAMQPNQHPPSVLLIQVPGAFLFCSGSEPRGQQLLFSGFTHAHSQLLRSCLSACVWSMTQRVFIA